MKKYGCITILLLLISLITSCRKAYECECITVVSDDSGPGSAVSGKIYVTPYRMTHAGAETWCNSNEQNKENGAGKHITTSCSLGRRR